MEQIKQVKTFDELERELENMYDRHKLEIDDLEELQDAEISAKVLELIAAKEAMHPELVKGAKVIVDDTKCIFSGWYYGDFGIAPILHRLKKDGKQGKSRVYFYNEENIQLILN